MKLIDKWNYMFVRNWNKLDSQVLEMTKLNSRADKAFNRVTAIFALTGDKVDVTAGFCQARLEITNPNGSIDLDCRYELKKMLLGRSYDLHISSTVNNTQLIQSERNCGNFHLFIKYRGSFRKKRLYMFSDVKCECANKIMALLSHDLIKERILKLDLTEMRVTYNQEEGSFQITITILKGSATWCLIPPVFQYIDIQQADIVCIIELLQLIQHQLQQL